MDPWKKQAGQCFPCVFNDMWNVGHTDLITVHIILASHIELPHTNVLKDTCMHNLDKMLIWYLVMLKKMVTMT